MLFLILLLIPLIVILIIYTNFSMNRAENPENTVQFRILVIISTSIIILPLKVILNISGICNIYILITIVTILITKFFNSIYAHNTLPSIRSLLYSTLVSLFVVILVNPSLYYYLSFLFELDFINFKEYTYYFSCICHLVLDTVYIESVCMTKRLPEVEEKIKDKRQESYRQDFRCKRAFDKYTKELNPNEKRNRFRELLSLVGKRRDLCKEIDSLANNKSSSTAFKGKDYSRFVAGFILSLKKK